MKRSLAMRAIPGIGTRSPLKKRMLSVTFAVLTLSGLAGVCFAEEREVVQAHFANSCKAEVQAEFDQAVTLLHSFEYPETTRLFKRIINRDPACAMAYWGSAMSIWHPLWAPPSKSELKAGMAILAQTDHLPATPRERGYINALKSFFSSTDTVTNGDRARAYENNMKSVYENNLDDPEAAVFYALAIRATARPGDKSYAQQFKAAGILNWVRQSLPTHPGILHYLIHSYDYPGLAHLALDAARTYANAAPDSAHAQHMPTHIFTRLGLWEDSIASNHDSTKSAADYTIRAQLPGHYDEGLHSMDYLMYAYLQTARDEEAQALLHKLRHIGKTDTEGFKVAFTYAASPARYALERRQWKQASELTLKPEGFDWQDFGWAEAIHYFARGLGAARLGKIDQARQEINKILKLQEALPETTMAYLREEVQVQVEVIKSWILLAEGKKNDALQQALAAAEREDSVDKHPVTPGEVLPARELYADMLFVTGNYKQALEQYRNVLNGAPNRLNALLGAGRAAKQSGNKKEANAFFNIARAQAQHGNRPDMGL